MENNFDTIKITDEDVYFILYLSKIEEVPLHQLEEQFSLCRDSVKKILAGETRKTCYVNFIAVEKHLRETS